MNLQDYLTRLKVRKPHLYRQVLIDLSHMQGEIEFRDKHSKTMELVISKIKAGEGRPSFILEELGIHTSLQVLNTYGYNLMEIFYSTTLFIKVFNALKSKRHSGFKSSEIIASYRITNQDMFLVMERLGMLDEYKAILSEYRKHLNKIKKGCSNGAKNK